MNTRSIRFRLTVWYGLALAVALVLFGGLIWVSLRQRLVGELDAELNAGSGRFEAYFRRESQEAEGAHLISELEEFCQALPATTYLSLRGPGFAFRHKAPGVGDRMMRRSFNVGNESFLLETGASTAALDHTLSLLAYLLLGLIPVVAAVAGLGGAWMSRRALRPVADITAAADAIGIENLSRRLPVSPTGDELEGLAHVWNSMLARLEGAVKTLSQFAADASHELRTPLAVVRTTAELALRRARSPESYQESLREIEAEAERMTRLVEDLLFLARADTAAAAMPMEPVDLTAVAREVAAELRGLAEARGIAIGVETERATMAVMGNRAALRRLLLVLLDNAIKYSNAASEVGVTLRRREDSVEIAVRDRGVGISAEDLPHVFQRFYRADKARSEGGHGLGLSLAWAIAQAHGAGILVESEPGRGSVFTTTFRSAGAQAES